jgi:hypothetical protein
MLKIKPNVFAGVILALVIAVPLISVMIISYEPLLGDSRLATIFKEETFIYVCVIALYAIGYALTSAFYWLLKEINKDLFEDVLGGPLHEQEILKLMIFAPAFTFTFLNPLMNYITNY